MATLPIVKLPHSVLRNVAAEVPLAEIPGARIQRLISDMQETLAASTDGVGLAAPQVNVPLRVFIVSSEAASIDANARGEPGRTIRIDANDANVKKEWQYFVFINPVLKKRSRAKAAMAEGCLSVPGKFGEVARPEKVFLAWQDERGRKHAAGFTRFLARVIQHELDHLEGTLIVDRAKRLSAVPGHGREH